MIAINLEKEAEKLQEVAVKKNVIRLKEKLMHLPLRKEHHKLVGRDEMVHILI